MTYSTHYIHLEPTDTLTVERNDTGLIVAATIPPLLLGRRPRPVTTDHRTLLDRVSPPDQSDPAVAERWIATLTPNLRRTA